MIRRYKLKTVFPQKKFQINYEKDLTEEQLPIVTSSGGPVLVIAGAGSGKTRTITYRVAYLVESGIAPDRILLVTFTNKAAREMIRRVENLLKINLKHLWAGTFHHIGNMILRHHARVLGYKENYAILDEADSKDLLEACIPELGKKIEKRMFPKGDVLKDILSFAINSRVSIEESVLTKASHFVDLIPDINKIAEIYERRKKKQNLMDFDDLLLNWDRLLKENKEIKEKYAKKFLHTLVDEYQDTNVIQAEIIDNLASVNRNVMVVGDDSQSIYSFRGAYFKNIIEFPKRYPDVKIYKLEINHRSTPQILNLANESIKQAKYRFEKKLKAVKKGGVKPGLAPLSDIYEQAAFVAQRILELRDQGVPLSQIAVLYRSHYHSLELQMELMRMGIPFVVRSGLRFFEEAHIKDVLAHLKIFHNPLDELAWKRVLKLMPGIGIRLSDKIWKFLSASGDSLSAIKSDRLAKELPSAAKDSLADLVSLLRILGKLLDSPAEMIRSVLEGDYKSYLQVSFPNAEERTEDINQLANYALRFKSLEKFLSELALVGGIAAEDIVAGEGEEEENLTLSTVHQAKGLEWKAVFIIYLAEGRFPSARSFGIESAEEEERRLFYVAVTRAKDELYLTYPITSRGFEKEGKIILRPSRFLNELPESVYEKWEVETEAESVL